MRKKRYLYSKTQTTKAIFRVDLDKMLDDVLGEIAGVNKYDYKKKRVLRKRAEYLFYALTGHKVLMIVC